jgi:transcriptional regulator with XRE-family HTH domain
MRTNVPRAIKALRQLRRWRQEDLGRRAGLSRDVAQRAEAGEVAGLTVRSLDRLAQALEAQLVVEFRWRGADLDRLIDAEHATLQATAAGRIERSGWLVRVEVSFNHFGDRGRCDIVAWHPGSRTVLIVEVKSALGDLQQTLGALDVKARLGGVIAQQLGWPPPARVVRSLVLAERGGNRRVLGRHESLFRQFTLRGRSALAWLRRPTADPGGLLWFESSDTDPGRSAPRRMER